jgi:hypothetical protein
VGPVKVQPFGRAAFRDALAGIRAVMTEDPDVFMPKIVDICAQSGVAVVLVSDVKGTVRAVPRDGSRRRRR